MDTYDYRFPSEEHWAPAYDDGDGDGRLAHLVFVDGRLVDSWHEPVSGSRWEHHAQRFDRQLKVAQLPPTPPPTPPHQKVLEWLAAACGGAAAVEALDATPLVEDGLDLPEVSEQHHRDRLEAVAELLDAVAVECFDAEASFALRRALLEVWRDDPEAVTGARTAAHVAGGICWAVGKANQLFRPQGAVTMGRVQDALGLSTAISGTGARVKVALWGMRPQPSHRPDQVPDLLPLGRSDLLLGSTRHLLIRVRDRAVAARDTMAA